MKRNARAGGAADESPVDPDVCWTTEEAERWAAAEASFQRFVAWQDANGIGPDWDWEEPEPEGPFVAVCGDGEAQEDVEPALVSASQLAQVLSIPRSTVYKLARDGEIPVYRAGRHLRFDVSEVRRSLRHGTKEEGEPDAAAGSVQLGAGREDLLADRPDGQREAEVDPAGRDDPRRGAGGVPRARRRPGPEPVLVKIPDFDRVD